MSRTLIWVSAGAASAVAAKLTLSENPEAMMVYCETGGEHPDNERFLADLVRWCNAPITRIKSEKYESTWDLWERRRFLSSVNGAICTNELKFVPRLNFQLPSDRELYT